MAMDLKNGVWVDLGGDASARLFSNSTAEIGLDNTGNFDLRQKVCSFYLSQ